MISAITTALATALGWVGEVVGAFTDTDGDLAALLPILAIGVGFTVIMFGIRVIRGMLWGS